MKEKFNECEICGSKELDTFNCTNCGWETSIYLKSEIKAVIENGKILRKKFLQGGKDFEEKCLEQEKILTKSRNEKKCLNKKLEDAQKNLKEVKEKLKNIKGRSKEIKKFEKISSQIKQILKQNKKSINELKDDLKIIELKGLRKFNCETKGNNLVFRISTLDVLPIKVAIGLSTNFFYLIEQADVIQIVELKSNDFSDIGNSWVAKYPIIAGLKGKYYIKATKYQSFKNKGEESYFFNTVNSIIEF